MMEEINIYHRQNIRYVAGVPSSLYVYNPNKLARILRIHFKIGTLLVRSNSHLVAILSPWEVVDTLGGYCVEVSTWEMRKEFVNNMGWIKGKLRSVDYNHRNLKWRQPAWPTFEPGTATKGYNPNATEDSLSLIQSNVYDHFHYNKIINKVENSRRNSKDAHKCILHTPLRMLGRCMDDMCVEVELVWNPETENNRMGWILLFIRYNMCPIYIWDFLNGKSVPGQKDRDPLLGVCRPTKVLPQWREVM